MTLDSVLEGILSEGDSEEIDENDHVKIKLAGKGMFVKFTLIVKEDKRRIQLTMFPFNRSLFKCNWVFYMSTDNQAFIQS